MKKILSYLSILGVAVVLWGCPYKSTVPLSAATEKVNKQALGKWLPKTELGKASPSYYVIEKRDSLHYDIEHFQFNDNDQEYTRKQYIAWTTRIDNLLFMNVQEQASKEFYLHRLDIMGDDLMILYQVTGNIDEKFDNSDKMREFFQQYMKLSFFYNTDEVELIRKKD
ncbi:MAG: hypothetical protein H6601_11195 [Flavobacteriales bacterium]|nr:hypothetical protein [Flavobacteriales bacterium]